MIYLVATFETLMRMRGNGRRYYLQQDMGDLQFYYGMDPSVPRPSLAMRLVDQREQAAGFYSQWAAQLVSYDLNSKARAQSVAPSRVVVVDRLKK